MNCTWKTGYPSTFQLRQRKMCCWFVLSALIQEIGWACIKKCCQVQQFSYFFEGFHLYSMQKGSKEVKLISGLYRKSVTYIWWQFYNCGEAVRQFTWSFNIQSATLCWSSWIMLRSIKLPGSVKANLPWNCIQDHLTSYGLYFQNVSCLICHW